MISVLTPSIRPEFLDLTQECLEQQTFNDFEWLVEIGLRSHGYQLPSDLNKLLKRAKGERVVMLQDCIKIEPNTLEMIDKLPNQMITFPVGKTLKFDGHVEWDWRAYKEWDIQPHQWEADFASAPLQAFIDVGGYDEDFNNGWSWENVEVAWRINALQKYTFLCNPHIKAVALDHDQIRENPFRGKAPNNDKRAHETRLKAERGVYKLDYLS